MQLHGEDFLRGIFLSLSLALSPFLSLTPLHGKFFFFSQGNGCPHTLGRSVGLKLTLDDFQKVSDKVPLLADLKPSGQYVMEDVHKVCINSD